MTTPTCWCPTPNLIPFNPDYLRCRSCQTLVCLSQPESPAAFYGRDYWTTRQTNTLGHPDIYHRARQDLSERAVYWLKTLLKYRRPPGKTLELGSGHGGFSALLKWAGFQAAGLEPHAWVSQLAHTVFNIPTLTGRLADQTLDPRSLDVIILLDVLEHLPDPVETLHLCFALLKPDGLLLIQTPSAPPTTSFEEMEMAESPFLKMLLPFEHLYLYSKQGIEQLLNQTGFQHIAYENTLFPYDMFLVAAASTQPEPLDTDPAETLQQSPSARLVLALIDLYQKWQEAETGRAERLQQIQDLNERLHTAESDREARLEQVAELTALLKQSEADRASRKTQIDALTSQLEEAETDRSDRLLQIEILSQKLQETEADRADRLIQIEQLTTRLSEVENDSAKRLAQVKELTALLEQSEADRAARLKQINELTQQLKESENDRAARLEQINELSRLLQESEADRAARMEQVNELTELLQESEADRAARLEQIQTLTAALQSLQGQPEDSDPATNP